jgi:hypothetical protein
MSFVETIAALAPLFSLLADGSVALIVGVLVAALGAAFDVDRWAALALGALASGVAFSAASAWRALADRPGAEPVAYAPAPPADEDPPSAAGLGEDGPEPAPYVPGPTTVEEILAERPTDGGRYLVTPADNERDLHRFMLKVEALILDATEGARSGEEPLAVSLELLDQAKDLVGPCTGYARALGWDERRIVTLRCSLLGAIGAAVRTVRSKKAHDARISRKVDAILHDVEAGTYPAVSVEEARSLIAGSNGRLTWSSRGATWVILAPALPGFKGYPPL